MLGGKKLTILMFCFSIDVMISSQYVFTQCNASCSLLTFIGQTGRSCQIKCNAFWMKGKTLSHSGAGMDI
jgi:hypothetical protein